MQIIPYQPEYQPYFESLNREWLLKYFYIEPIDEEVLANPGKHIIEPGGQVLFAEHEGKIIGTIALKWHGEGEIELTKMGVNENYQGLGAGKLLFETAINTARDMGAGKVILYSNTKLAPALSIYYKYGFTEIPIEDCVAYERCNIKMELNLV